MNNRIILSKNGTLKDLSLLVASYHTGSALVEIEALNDFIYISSRLPFNNIYLKLSQGNTQLSEMGIEYYGNNGWIEAVEVLDETLCMTKSGHVQFTPNKNHPWKMASTDEITELNTKVIYDQYWIRIKSSIDLSPVKIEWVGNLFSSDQDLGTEFPDLLRSTTLTSFKVGKTNWQEQHALAAAVIVGDLVNKGAITGVEQILNWRDFTNASVSKVSEIVFTSFGDDYIDNVISSRREYSERMSKRLNRIDKNNNAIEDKEERETSNVGYFTR